MMSLQTTNRLGLAGKGNSDFNLHQLIYFAAGFLDFWVVNSLGMRPVGYPNLSLVIFFSQKWLIR